jgi:hypothetical protein
METGRTTDTPRSIAVRMTRDKLQTKKEDKYVETVGELTRGCRGMEAAGGGGGRAGHRGAERQGRRRGEGGKHKGSPTSIV